MTAKQLAKVIRRSWEIREASFVPAVNPETYGGSYSKSEMDSKQEAYNECCEADSTLEKEFLPVIWCLDIGFCEVNGWVRCIESGTDPMAEYTIKGN